MRLRIRSIKNISQVTRALQAVSASKVRKAIAALNGTRPYATKAWQVLMHIAGQPGRSSLHPLLQDRTLVKSTLVVVVSGDRGLAGAYNANLIRFVFRKFGQYPTPVHFIAVGRKGRDLLLRRGQRVIADFSNLPAAPSFADVSAIGRLALDEFVGGRADEVFVVYTNFFSMARQEATLKMILPLHLTEPGERVEAFEAAENKPPAYTYEPDGREILDEIIPRFTAIQVYQAILESLASEHAARMVAMRNATDNALDLVSVLQLDYNKVRQQTITGDMLDIAGGAEALAQSLSQTAGGSNG
jgi:F-type H+-transporting ATPase subunit gamma